MFLAGNQRKKNCVAQNHVSYRLLEEKWNKKVELSFNSPENPHFKYR